MRAMESTLKAMWKKLTAQSMAASSSWGTEFTRKL
jgi:hypothetical protein